MLNEYRVNLIDLSDCLRFSTQIERDRNIEHVTVCCQGEENSNEAYRCNGEWGYFSIGCTKRTYCKGNSILQDPREALILSLKREVGALQTENDHLRAALHLNGDAQNIVRSESKGTH